MLRPYDTALLFFLGGFVEAIQQGHLILIDGTHAPYREPPNQSRTSRDKDFNTVIARIRVNVEHCIARLKTRRILSHGYRGRIKELPGIIHLVTNL